MTMTDAPHSPAARFWDRHAAGYAKRPVADEAAYRRKLEMTRARLTPTSEVYEFGCGTGTTALHHAPYAGRIVAEDVSPKMIAIAREKAAAAGVENVEFRVGAIDALSPPPGRYDMVMAHSILHLLADRHAAIAKAHAMLKPGGHFVSSTACLGDRMWWFAPIGFLGRLVGLLPLIRIFTKDRIRRDIEAAGFVVEEDWRPEGSVAAFIIARKAG